MESFCTWNNWKYLSWIRTCWSLSYSAGCFSMCMSVSAVHLKNESYTGLVYLQIWCVIGVFWGWTMAGGTPRLLWASSSLCGMSQGTWRFALQVTCGWSRSLCPKQKIISAAPRLFASPRVKRSSRRGQWMGTFREPWVEPWSSLCRWMLSCTFFHLPLTIMVMHH